MKNQIMGWHGTTKEAGEKIKSANFNISTGMRQWLGDGVYFFTDGIGDPRDHSLQWAKLHCKDTADWLALKVPINLEENYIWDLTDDKMLTAFNTAIEKFVSKLIHTDQFQSELGITDRSEIQAILSDVEGFYMNFIRVGQLTKETLQQAKEGGILFSGNSLPYKAVKCNYCFKLTFNTKEDMRGYKRVNRRLNNCTVLSVWYNYCILHDQIEFISSS